MLHGLMVIFVDVSVLRSDRNNNNIEKWPVFSPDAGMLFEAKEDGS